MRIFVLVVAASAIAMPAGAATRNFGITSFDKVRVDGPFKVRLTTGVAPFASATGSPAAIDRVGLGHLLGRDARELSLGERQLVLLALAVAQDAPALLLDEPTVHLDLRHQVEAMELLRDLNERDGTAMIAVLHDLGLAAHFFPRLVVIDRGRLVADGPPAEVLTDDLIRDVFGVEPALVRLAASGSSPVAPA